MPQDHLRLNVRDVDVIPSEHLHDAYYFSSDKVTNLIKAEIDKHLESETTDESRVKFSISSVTGNHPFSGRAEREYEDVRIIMTVTLPHWDAEEIREAAKTEIETLKFAYAEQRIAELEKQEQEMLEAQQALKDKITNEKRALYEAQNTRDLAAAQSQRPRRTARR